MVTVNAVGFYLTAAAVVLAALIVVAAPSFRMALASSVVLTAASAALLVVTGSYMLALLQIVLAALLLVVLRYLGRAGEGAGLLAAGPGRAVLWPGVVALCAACAALLVAVLAGHDASWHRGSGSASLVTLFHWRYPLALITGAGLLVLGGFAAWVLGGVSHDERRHEEVKTEKQLHEERMARRRADRLAARQARREGRSQA